MATTTQILFNDPALHSLKRDQLVKLCKIHSIKANGKNTELIERLKQYAHGLPGNALTDLDDAMEGVEEQTLELPGGMPVVEDEGEDQITTQTNYFPATANVNDNIEYDMQDIVLTSRFAMPRPSEQWEVVMDDIEEVDEVTIGTASSKNSLRTVSNGEFGTHSSKTTVSSSIKALATSLGIKRTHSKSCQQTQDIEAEDTNPKMPSFSPGKLFSSTKARDSLAAHATPYSEIPHSESLPDTDVFKFSTPDTSILGLNDDHDDDSNGETNLNAEAQSLLKPTLRVAGGVKSTIRLVSQPAASRSNQEYAYISPPRLPVVKTDFDLTMGTPGTLRSLNIWPASSFTAGKDAGQRLYPALPVEDLKADLEHEQETAMPGGIGMPTATPAKTPAKSDRFSVPSATKDTNAHAPVDEPDMFSPFKPSTAASGAVATSTPGRSAPHPPIPRSTPFLFGSPLPRHEPGSVIRSIDRDKHKDQEEGATIGVSNAAFDGVAKSVLEEMQRRVAEANAQNAKSGDGSARPLPAPPLFGPSLTFAVPTGAGIAQDRFAKLHQAEFSKMDSIATHYAARRPNKRKSDALGNGRPMAGQKRRSSAAGARVISAGSRKRMAVPGGFGGEDDSGGEEDEGVRGEADDDEDAGARRSSKRMRITQGWDVHRGQRVSLAPPLAPAEEEKKQKEREAVKRDLDAAKARRRSSRGRPSMGAPPARGKASKFGFLASAKSIVRNVWNIGGGSKAKPSTAPSSIPVPKPSQAPPPTAPDIAKKKAKTMTDTAPKQPAGNARQASGSQPRGSSQSSTSSKLLKPSGSATDGKATVTTGSRSRSPIPPFTAQTASVKSTSTATSRPSSIMGTTRSRVSASNTVPTSGTAASRQTSRTSTVSSMGTRTSIASGSSAAVSSMGTRRSLVSASNTASASSKNDKNLPDVKNQPTLRKRTSSLLAPTASSLAKINATVKPSLTGRTSGLSPVAETQLQSKRASITTQARSARASIMSTNSSPLSPRPTRIFSQPLTNFVSPASSSSGTHNHPSLTAAATSIMTSAEADAASSPSKIPRPAVLPPKPKQLIARKPRISRSRVIAKLGAQRAAAQGASVPGSPGARTRSSMGAVGRRSLGGVKSGGRASAGADVMRAAVKKRARQSEYTRRKSRTTSENERREVDE